jgi:hypothetical protein
LWIEDAQPESAENPPRDKVSGRSLRSALAAGFPLMLVSFSISRWFA